MKWGSLIPTSFRGTYGTLLVAAVLGPALLFAAIAAWSWQHVRYESIGDIRRVTDLLQKDALKVFETAAIVLDRIDDRAAGLSSAELAQRGAELSRFLAGIPASVGEIDAALIADADGTVRAASRKIQRPSIGDRRYFAEVQTGGGVVIDGPLHPGPETAQVIALARRLSSDDGRFRGAAIVIVAVPHLTDTWKEIVVPGDTVSLVRDDGLVVARYPEIPPTAGGSTAHFSEATMAQLRVSDNGILNSVSAIDGIARIDGYRRLGGYPLHIVYAVDRRNIDAQWYPILVAFGALAAAASAQRCQTPAGTGALSARQQTDRHRFNRVDCQALDRARRV